VLKQLKDQQPTCEIPVAVRGAYAIVLTRATARQTDCPPQESFALEQLLQHVNPVITLAHSKYLSMLPPQPGVPAASLANSTGFDR
jgi:hypothetical protein